nr:MAG TPA: hypothetical protein [Microviridae sp.]
MCARASCVHANFTCVDLLRSDRSRPVGRRLTAPADRRLIAR